MIRHNGKQYISEVQSTWECEVPDDSCVQTRALSSLGNVQECIIAQNEGPLDVNFIIDLHFFNMASKVNCDSNIDSRPFNPFLTCANDPNVLKAECHLGCKYGFPYEYCKLELDPRGALNMSDRVVDTCLFQTECRSPHVEATSIVCNSQEAQNYPKYAPEIWPLPNRAASDQVTPETPLSVQTELSHQGLLSLALWIIVMLAICALSMLLCGIALPEVYQRLALNGSTYATSPSPSVVSMGTPLVWAQGFRSLGASQGLQKTVGEELVVV
jgi:hypothetical protein